MNIPGAGTTNSKVREWKELETFGEMEDDQCVWVYFARAGRVGSWRSEKRQATESCLHFLLKAVGSPQGLKHIRIILQSLPNTSLVSVCSSA